MRIGIGYDIHRFKKGRKLMLGGLEVPHGAGLEGHSDGDALLHAVVDALLGAAGLGDIGEFFSDTNSRWKGMSSLRFLDEASKKVRAAGYRVVNVDAVVLTELPKLGPYKKRIAEQVAQTLKISPSAVSVKAKTNERLGEIGKGRALAVHAVVLIEKKR